MIPYVLRSATLLLMFGLTQSANADTYLATDTIINYNTGNYQVVVGYANQSDFDKRTNGTSPTVSLVTPGSARDGLAIYNSSTVNVSGGDTAYLRAYDSSRVDISGGIIYNGVLATDNSIVNVSGGDTGDLLEADQRSILNLFGTGLSDRLVNPNYYGYSQYAMSGRLADGSKLAGTRLYIQNGTGAQVIFHNTAVPEPGSLALFGALGIGTVSLLLRKRLRSV